MISGPILLINIAIVSHILNLPQHDVGVCVCIYIEYIYIYINTYF